MDNSHYYRVMPETDKSTSEWLMSLITSMNGEDHSLVDKPAYLLVISTIWKVYDTNIDFISKYGLVFVVK